MEKLVCRIWGGVVYIDMNIYNFYSQLIQGMNRLGR